MGGDCGLVLALGSPTTGSYTWAWGVVPELEPYPVTLSLVLTPLSMVWATYLVSFLPLSFLPRKEEDMAHVRNPLLESCLSFALGPAH